MEQPQLVFLKQTKLLEHFYSPGEWHNCNSLKMKCLECVHWLIEVKEARLVMDSKRAVRLFIYETVCVCMRVCIHVCVCVYVCAEGGHDAHHVLHVTQLSCQGLFFTTFLCDKVL